MRRLGIVLVIWFIGLEALPGSATLPPLQITIESGSPYFLPVSATVTTGAPIRWDNPTASHHTVTHDGCISEESQCTFDSGPVLPNGSYTLSSLPAGRYPYHCRLHPVMRGTLTVIEPAAPSQT